jgi:hypothetical protein
MIMYVRFVTPLIHPDSRVESGFFRAAWYLDGIGCPDWIRTELDEQFAWFNDNLPCPRAASQTSGRFTVRGVCWFTSAAKECIDRGRYCAWLITEAGLPVEMLKLRRVRAQDVIWRDDYQVVAKARSTPRAFRGRPVQVAWDA